MLKPLPLRASLTCMNKIWLFYAGLGAAAFVAGCAAPLPPGAEAGPHHTMAYDVLVEASPPGARIEAEGSNIGNTPCHLKIFGDPDGTFHDFGSFTYTVRAFPITSNQYPQIIVFGTGKYFTHEDRIPRRIYFDMNRRPAPYYYPPPGYGGYPQQGYPPQGYPYQPPPNQYGTNQPYPPPGSPPPGSP